MSRPIVLFLLLGFAPRLAAADPATAFFEQKIRPVLVEKCYSCHSAEAKKGPKGGLRLDSRAAVLAGGDSGPVLVPGKPTEGTLLKALRGSHDVSLMPPSGKLPDAVIADFEKWIRTGAADPRIDTAKATKQTGLTIEAGKEFWSYKPPVMPKIPTVKDSKWPANNIDRFILAKLEAAKLRPSPDADKATLIRRLYYDLTGLPAAPEEVDAFVRDKDPAAYEKLVDRLIASPGFGERWGRHWLDIVRFAESITLRGSLLKDTWQYRDYVIDSFDRDMPFNQFVREQVAGDLLTASSVPDRRRQIIATAFLMMGNNNLEEQDKKALRMDVVDEQLDVVTKGFLGQTVTCARCHDHKFDPIPTRDYYALAGILRNSRTLETANVSIPIEVPLPEEPALEAALVAHEAKMADLTNRIKSAKAKKPAATATGGILAVKDVPGIAVDDADAKKVGDWTHSTFSKNYVGTGYSHDANMGKGEKTLTFDPDITKTGKYEVWLAYSPGAGRATNVPVTVFSADGEKTIDVNMQLSPSIEGRWISLGTYRFEADGQSYVIVSNEGTKGIVSADAMTFIPEAEAATRDAGTQVKTPIKVPTDEVKKMEAELANLKKTGPKRQVSLSVIEEKKIENARIHIRGNVSNLGAEVPRGFLQVATRGPAPKMPENQSGRKELADWLASADNPLTARVFANRVWHWLFGSGIVRTVDNFGTTGEKPSHPELLDYLAIRFVEDGWSVKKLVRQIVLSHTYRQASSADAKLVAADPENKLFGHANRRRLEAECIRDTVLSVSGALTRDRGGKTFAADLANDYNYRGDSNRRSVYLPVFRNSIPEFFEVFDFADPSVTVGQRSASTVAPQALYLLNNPFVAEQAKRAAARLLEEPLKTDAERISRAYRLAVGREPTAGERAVAEKFLKANADPETAWAGVFHALFASADFRFVE